MLLGQNVPFLFQEFLTFIWNKSVRYFYIVIFVHVWCFGLQFCIELLDNGPAGPRHVGGGIKQLGVSETQCAQLVCFNILRILTRSTECSIVVHFTVICFVLTFGNLCFFSRDFCVGVKTTFWVSGISNTKTAEIQGYWLISFTIFNAQFLYSLTICMLHYNPRHVSSFNMPIFRRTNCIITASGIVTL